MLLELLVGTEILFPPLLLLPVFPGKGEEEEEREEEVVLEDKGTIMPIGKMGGVVISTGGRFKLCSCRFKVADDGIVIGEVIVRAGKTNGDDWPFPCVCGDTEELPVPDDEAVDDPRSTI